LRRLGVNVDFAAVDWGTNAARRAQKSPPGQGGWQMFHTWHAGAVCIDPSSYTAIRANGDKAWFGWPTSAKVEAEITAWYAAKNPGRGKGRKRRAKQGRFGGPRLRPDRFLPGLSGRAKKHGGDREGAAPVLLGREQSRVNAFPARRRPPHRMACQTFRSAIRR